MTSFLTRLLDAISLVQRESQGWRKKDGEGESFTVICSGNKRPTIFVLMVWMLYRAEFFYYLESTNTIKWKMLSCDNWCIQRRVLVPGLLTPECTTKQPIVDTVKTLHSLRRQSNILLTVKASKRTGWFVCQSHWSIQWFVSTGAFVTANVDKTSFEHYWKWPKLKPALHPIGICLLYRYSQKVPRQVCITNYYVNYNYYKTGITLLRNFTVFFTAVKIW